MKKIIFYFAIIGAGVTQAQTTFRTNGTAIINVTGSTILNVKGNYTNRATTVNQATIRIGGNTTNTGLYQSTGVEEFVGTSDQMVEGVNATFSSNFGLMKKNQPAGVNIILKTNTDTDSVNFGTNSGYIDANLWGTTLWIKSFDYRAIANADSSRYVVATNKNGFLKRSTDDFTLGHRYFFPIGAGPDGSYRGNEIQLYSLETSGTGFITESVMVGLSGAISYDNTFSCGTIGFSYLQEDRVNIQSSDTGDYWYAVYLNRSGTPMSHINLRTVLSETNVNDYQGNIANFLVGTLDTNICGFIDQSGLSTLAPGGQYTNMNNVDVTVASQFQNPLPVEFIGIKADPMQTFIRVSWSTASELNNLGYWIERSTDATHFEVLGWIDGHGTTNAPQHYRFDDNTAVTNVRYYYRVRQIDWDKTEKISPMASSMLFSALIKVFSLRPSLTTGYVFPSSKSFTSAELYDLAGKHLATFSNKDYFDISAFPNGMYLFKITFESGMISSQKIMKTK